MTQERKIWAGLEKEILKHDTMNYTEFLESKKHSIGNSGFEANYIPDMAFDFQKYEDILY